MKGKSIGIAAFLAVVVLLLASCNLFPPDTSLRVVDPHYTIIGGDDVRIFFTLYNSGSEALKNCKVKWYVDDFDNDAAGANSDADIEYDEITGWAPSIGVDLEAYSYTEELSVVTTSGIFGGGVNFYGIYEMGWNADE